MCARHRANCTQSICKHEATHHLPYIFCENNSIWKIKKEKNWCWLIIQTILNIVIITIIIVCAEWRMVSSGCYERTNGTNSEQVAHVARTHWHRNWRRRKKLESLLIELRAFRGMYKCCVGVQKYLIFSCRICTRWWCGSRTRGFRLYRIIQIDFL